VAQKKTNKRSAAGTKIKGQRLFALNQKRRPRVLKVRSGWTARVIPRLLPLDIVFFAGLLFNKRSTNSELSNP